MTSPTRKPKLEKKFSTADLSQADTDGSFEGYASLFDRQDLANDIVLPGAFRASLAKRKPSDIKMLFQHDPNQVIGVWTDIHEDQTGLFVKGQLLPDVERSREVLSLMRAGAIDGLSIGFKTVKAKHDKNKGARRLSEVDLWEISIVTFPMLPDAKISSVKSRDDLPTEREFERWLTQDAGFTRTQAKSIIRDGFKDVVVKQDAAGMSDEDAANLLRKIRQAVDMFENFLKRG